MTGEIIGDALRDDATARVEVARPPSGHRAHAHVLAAAARARAPSSSPTAPAVGSAAPTSPPCATASSRAAGRSRSSSRRGVSQDGVCRHRPVPQDEAWLPVVQALRTGRGRLPGPLVLAGKSNGARVACRTAGDLGADAVLCLSFPLHPPGKPEVSRADELRLPLAARHRRCTSCRGSATRSAPRPRCARSSPTRHT